MNHNKKEALKDIFRSKPLYFAIGLCMIAIGFLAYSTSNGKAPVEISTNSLDEINTTLQAGETDEVRGDVTGIPDTRKSTTELSTQLETQSQELPSENTTQAESTTRPASTYFALPLGTDISTDYSYGEMVYSPVMNDWRSHNGVDFKGSLGDTVKSIADGVVLDVYDDPLWGVVLEIEHGGGIVAKYCGFGKGSTVEKGSEVKLNETIGNLGEIPIEANNDSAHIHLEIRANGVLADPLEVMGRNGSSDD